MLCILYVNAVGFLLGLAALQVERALPQGFPRRWLWCIAIPMSLVIPAYYRMNHAAPVGRSDAGLGAHVDALDPTINQVWHYASLVLLSWAVVSVCRVWYLVRSARGSAIGRGAPRVVDGVRVLVSDALGPATVGLLRSHVLLPRWVLALPETQRRYVVRHEEEHRRAHDGLLLFIASLLLIVAPWHLALWWQLRRLSLAVEMDCDDRVVRALGDAPAYGSLLLKVAEAGSRGPQLQPALLGGAGSLERRLTRLMSPAPLRLVQRLLLPVAAAVLLLIVLAVPHPVLAPSHAHAPASSGAGAAR